MDEQTYRVGELNRRFAAILTGAFAADIWVRGEVTSMVVRSGRRFELTERDEAGGRAARLRVALLGRERDAVEAQLAAAGVDLIDGVEVRIRGRVDFWIEGGQISLRMTGVDPAFTLGRIAAERERILQVLTAEGLLRRNREVYVSPVPLVVGLITSNGSAAHRDVMAQLEASGVAFRVLLADARMQGAATEEMVCRALRVVASRGAEVVIIARGGGSKTDLAWFDREAIARAIAASPVAVLTGIGHEVDRSIADLVAHRSYPTPTACAAALVDRVVRYRDRVEHVRGRVAHHAVRRIDREAERLTVAAVRAGRAAQVGLRQHSQRLDDREARVRAADPQLVLARGFSITRDGDGRLVRDAAAVAAGALLTTRLAAGELVSRVEP